jgi:hypothetical protein
MASTSRSERSSGGEEEAVQWRRRWSFPSLTALPSGSVQGLGGVSSGDSEPREVSPGPHLLYVACATGAHQPCVAEHPRSGRGQGIRVGRWANSVKIYSNILPLDINLSFKL